MSVETFFYSFPSFNRPQILVLCPLKETLEPEFRRLLSLASQLKHGEYLCELVMFCSRFIKLLLLPIWEGWCFHESGRREESKVKTFTLCDPSLSIKFKLSLLRAVLFLGRGLTIVGSILEGDFKERTEDVALAKEVRGRFRYWLISECLELILW